MEPLDPEYDARVRASFAKQQLMATLGVSIAEVAPGRVTLRLPFRADLTQQHGFLHAGAIAALADSACGYAALSLMPRDAAVLSIEFKINMLSPARGAMFVARGEVVRAGRTITVCRADVLASGETAEAGTGAGAATAGTLVATMQATMMAVTGRPLSD